MKKTILLNVMLAVLMAAGAQNDSVVGYRSIFGRESTVWNGATEHVDQNWENHVLQTDGDTIIDGYSYKIVSWENWIEFYLREDTLTGKVWCRYPEWVPTLPGYYLEADTDYLIMDLSLETGDSIILSMTYGPMFHKFYVSSIDYFDSMKHVVLMDDYDEYGYYGSKVEFVEGAGCSNLFGMIYMGQYENVLVCCQKDGELVFHNPTHPLHQEGDSCRIPASSSVSVIVDNCLAVNVSPNPCTDWIVIEGENIQSASLCDINGITLLSNINVHERIDMVDIPKGVFFLRIVHNNTSTCKKIIKR